MFALAAVLAAGCEETENMDPVGNWELSTPTLSAPAPDATLTLDENAPDEAITFTWTPASATNRFGVSYTLALVPAGSDDYNDAILTVVPANAGKAQSVSVTAAEIDYALWAACYPAGASVDLEWVVIASAIDKETTASHSLSVTRFETEHSPESLFIYGSATEAGDAVDNATPMRSIPDAEGEASGVFDVYTTLTAGATYSFRDRPNAVSRGYGGADGTLEPCGPAIAAPETGQYRVTVDLTNNTYTLLKIDRWSLVGDAVEGGWGGDVPLSYQGDGVWGGEIPLLSESGFIFRANGDWAYLLKRVQGTATGDNKGGNLVMESEGNALGIPFEDIPGAVGVHRVTLDLSTDPYTYRLTAIETGPVEAVIGETSSPNGDAVSGNFDIADMDAPEAVYLLSGGDVVAEFTLNGSLFVSDGYIALQEGETYTLNTAEDGSGEEVVDGDIAVARDQAYTLSIDFSTGKFMWKYYNLKLFHWDEVGGGWDDRQELLMTYIHPYKFEVTGTLSGGYHSKVFSPWDIEFGTVATTLTGTFDNVSGSPNYTGITQNGTYKLTLVIAPDYKTAEYAFVKQ